MNYTNLPQKRKDVIYRQMQRIKVKKNLIQGRCFYNREDYTPVPVCDIMKILKSLNSSIANPKNQVTSNIASADFLYDFLEIIQLATAQGIESEIPDNVKDFYNTIIIPIVNGGKLKNKVKSLLSNIHDPLFITQKSYPWLRLDYPKEIVLWEDILDEGRYPSGLHYYYYLICPHQSTKKQIPNIGTVQELKDFVNGCVKRGIKFNHNFGSLVEVFSSICAREPNYSVLMNTGERPICYIDNDAYLGVVIRNNGTPAPYLQTTYSNLKIGKNKAGQALMQARHNFAVHHLNFTARKEHERKKTSSTKRAAVKAFVRKIKEMDE